MEGLEASPQCGVDPTFPTSTALETAVPERAFNIFLHCRYGCHDVADGSFDCWKKMFGF